MSNSILIANRDSITLEAMRQALKGDRKVFCTPYGRVALEIAETRRLNLAIIDAELSDMTGLDLIRALHPGERRLPCLFITRLGYDASNVEAIRLGVTDCIEQPLTIGVLLSAVRRATTDGSATNLQTAARHSLNRWVDMVLRVVELPNDVRTLEEWGRSIAVSVGALRNWCRTANLPARRSLLFARMLRAVVRQRAHPMPPAELLNVVDRRTLTKMLVDAGGTSTDLPISEEEFLTHQRFITNADAVNMLRAALLKESYRVGRRVHPGRGWSPWADAASTHANGGSARPHYLRRATDRGSS